MLKTKLKKKIRTSGTRGQGSLNHFFALFVYPQKKQIFLEGYAHAK